MGKPEENFAARILKGIDPPECRILNVCSRIRELVSADPPDEFSAQGGSDHVMDEKKDTELPDFFDDLGNACSSGDCTGLIPANPPDEYGRESYESVYRFLAKPVSKNRREED